MKTGKQDATPPPEPDDSKMTATVVLSSFGLKIKNRIYRQTFCAGIVHIDSVLF